MVVQSESGIKAMLLGIQFTLVGFILVLLGPLDFFTDLIGGLLVVLGVVFSLAGFVE